MSNKPEKTIEEIIAADGRYCLEGVRFVREGLSYTMDKFFSDKKTTGGPQHVSGAQLCQGLRQLAIERWGLLARKVLQRWNITTTRDFGEIVFLLVNNDWLKKEPHDCIEDFDDIYDFEEAFDEHFDISLDN